MVFPILFEINIQKWWFHAVSHTIHSNPYAHFEGSFRNPAFFFQQTIAEDFIHIRTLDGKLIFTFHRRMTCWTSRWRSWSWQKGGWSYREWMEWDDGDPLRFWIGSFLPTFSKQEVTDCFWDKAILGHIFGIIRHFMLMYMYFIKISTHIYMYMYMNMNLNCIILLSW